MPSASSSMPAVSISSSSTQAHLLPSTSLSLSSVIPTIQSESQFPIPISSTTTSPGHSLNTSSTLSTETRLFPTTSNKFAALQTEIQPSFLLPESAATASNSEHSNASKIPKSVKQNLKKKQKKAKISTETPEIVK
ncbi:hypothetical protein TNCV_678491 [Trichonephila clavipes]|nr:hypothetical protein TNCV_678491 [Trichonephila clavipes]